MNPQCIHRSISIDQSCRARKAMKWMRVRMSQWWNGCTFCERNKAFSASSSRMRELCLATWAFSDATSEVVVDWYRGRQQERKKKQRTYSRRSMARDDSGGDLWRRVDSDAKLGFRSVVHGETLEETRSAKSIAELRSVSCTNSNLNS